MSKQTTLPNFLEEHNQASDELMEVAYDLRAYARAFLVFGNRAMEENLLNEAVRIEKAVCEMRLAFSGYLDSLFRESEAQFFGTFRKVLDTIE